MNLFRRAEPVAHEPQARVRLSRVVLLLWLVLFVPAVVGLVALGFSIAGDLASETWAWARSLVVPEDVGVRLRRECEAIVREAQPYGMDSRLEGERASFREQHVKECILKRGLAGR